MGMSIGAGPRACFVASAMLERKQGEERRNVFDGQIIGNKKERRGVFTLSLRVIRSTYIVYLDCVGRNVNTAHNRNASVNTFE
jgi:hypothetical protein